MLPRIKEETFKKKILKIIKDALCKSYGMKGVKNLKTKDEDEVFEQVMNSYEGTTM